MFSLFLSLRKLEPILFLSKIGRSAHGLSTFFCIFALSLHSIQVFGASETSYSLPRLLKLLEKAPLLTNEVDAMKRMAKGKVQEVEMKRWLTTFEAKAYGGVVPDGKLTDPRDLNSFRSYDFENDFSFSHLGGFFRTEVEIIQPIWTFGKISNYQDAAKMGFTLAEWEQRKRTSEFRYLVKRAFYTLLYSTESITTLKEVETRLKDAAEKVEKQLLKDADNVFETDRLKIKVFQADVGNRMIDAVRGQKISKAALAEMLDLAGDWVVDQDKLIAEQVEGLEKSQIVSAALRARPELQQLATLISIKESERLAIRGDLFPTIFVAGKINFAVAPGREDIKNPFLVDDFNKFDLGAVLGMKMDLGFYRTINKMDQIRAEIDRMKAQRAQLMAKVKLDAEKSFEEAVGAVGGIVVNEDGFRAARSWLTSAGLAFNLGTAETKDVLESFAAFFKARADLVRSVFNLNMALSELSDVAGTEVVQRLQ